MYDIWKIRDKTELVHVHFNYLSLNESAVMRQIIYKQSLFLIHYFLLIEIRQKVYYFELYVIIDY